MYTEEKNILRVETGNEFKIYVAPDGIISEREVFWNEYLMAARTLNSIVKRDVKSSECDYQNNIIAFCGERGTGKTSAMINFGNAIKNCEKNSKLNFSKEVMHLNIVQDILIDPSVFDGIHSILDIVVAKMYRKFSEAWRKTKSNKGAELEGKYDAIVCSFQKVYGELSLINNSSKILESEYDYDGNVGKLSKLGKSLNLKNDFYELISQYLDFIANIEKKSSKGREILLLEIDDIDLCSGNAYKMLEEIRKYLLLPNVIILMAVRLEQLELCVEEQNYKDFNTLYRIEPKLVKNEVQQMTAKYLLKLIPEPRRILLSQKNIYDSQLKVILNNGENAEQVTDAVCRMIYENTGVIIPWREIQLFLPKELRGLINLLTFLNQMKKDDEAEKLYNIGSILNYTREVLIRENVIFEDYGKLLMRLIDLDAKWLNHSVAELFLETKETIDMNQIINLSLKEFDYEKYVTAIMIQYIYTLKLNAEKEGLEANIKYNVWGESIIEKLPDGKENVEVNTLETLKLIGKNFEYVFYEDWLEEGKGDKLISRPTVLRRSKMYEEWIEVLLLFLAFLKNDGKQIYISKTTSSFISKAETIGLTNFLTNIQNLDSVVKNSGILDADLEDAITIWNIADKLKNRYKVSIDYLTNLYSNPLLCFYVQKAISEGKEYKEKADDQTRLERQCERILESIFTIPKECRVNKNVDNKLEMHRKFIDDISKMYAKMVSTKSSRPARSIEEDIRLFEKRITGSVHETGAIWNMKIRFNRNSMTYSELKSRMETIAHNVAVRKTTIGNSSVEQVSSFYNEKFREMMKFYIYVCHHDMDMETYKDDRDRYKEFVNIAKGFLEETEQEKNGI